jgi:hypothetical protein
MATHLQFVIGKVDEASDFLNVDAGGSRELIGTWTYIGF